MSNDLQLKVAAVNALVSAYQAHHVADPLELELARLNMLQQLLGIDMESLRCALVMSDSKEPGDTNPERAGITGSIDGVSYTFVASPDGPKARDLIDRVFDVLDEAELSGLCPKPPGKNYH